MSGDDKVTYVSLSMMVAVLGLFIILSACTEDKVTAPYDYTINMPANSTKNVSHGNAYCFFTRITVSDILGKPVNGIKLQIKATGDTAQFNNFYSTSACSGAGLGDPYDAVTNDYGYTEINYGSAVFSCNTTSGKTFEIGYSAASGALLGETTMTIKCTL